MEKITSKTNQKIIDAYKLKGHPSDDLFLVEGFHLVELEISSGIFCMLGF